MGLGIRGEFVGRRVEGGNERLQNEEMGQPGGMGDGVVMRKDGRAC